MIRHSIIIPTSGQRFDDLTDAIKSILSLNLENYNSELIIVCNTLRDELIRDLTKHFTKQNKCLRFIHEPSPGLTAARHSGVKESRGNLLTFLDDDVEVSLKWLRAIQFGFDDEKVAMVGGPSIPKFTGSIPAWFWSFMTTTPYGGYMNTFLSLIDIGQNVENIDPIYIFGLNFSIRKKIFYNCGGFHPDLVPLELMKWQGDGETGLSIKIRAAGLRADYLQEALLYHKCGPDRLNIKYFKKRAFYQGVCDSYSQLRYKNTIQLKKNIFDKVPDELINYLRKKYQLMKSWVGKKLLSGERDDIKKVKTITKLAYKDGYNFHNEAALSDQELIKWIIKEDYLDADLRNFLKKK